MFLESAFNAIFLCAILLPFIKVVRQELGREAIGLFGRVGMGGGRQNNNEESGCLTEQHESFYEEQPYPLQQPYGTQTSPFL